MGRARLSFRDLIKEGQEDVDLYFDLKYKAEIVGKINVVTTWHPEESPEEEKKGEKVPGLVDDDKTMNREEEEAPMSTRQATEYE